MSRVKGRAARVRQGPTDTIPVTMLKSDIKDLEDYAKDKDISRAMAAEDLIIAGLYGVNNAPTSASEKDFRIKIHEQKMRIEALERQAESDASEIGALNKQLRGLRSEVQSNDLTKENEELRAKLQRAYLRLGELSLG